MENSTGSNRQFNEDLIQNTGSSSGKNTKVSFHEFKHSVLLHEKGLAMQDSSTKFESAASKGKYKTVSHAPKTLTDEQISENREEVSELSLRFKERHI